MKRELVDEEVISSLSMFLLPLFQPCACISAQKAVLRVAMVIECHVVPSLHVYGFYCKLKTCLCLGYPDSCKSRKNRLADSDVCDTQIYV